MNNDLVKEYCKIILNSLIYSLFLSFFTGDFARSFASFLIFFTAMRIKENDINSGLRLLLILLSSIIGINIVLTVYGKGRILMRFIKFVSIVYASSVFVYFIENYMSKKNDNHFFM